VEKADEGSITLSALSTLIRIDRKTGFKKGDPVHISLRPEYIRINPKTNMGCEIQGKMEQEQYLGSYGLFYVAVEEVILFVELHDITEKDIQSLPKEGEAVTLGFRPEDCILMQ
jgi:ABC-type Fe3+/spermidine/putrescine transport system ATPase subunit